MTFRNGARSAMLILLAGFFLQTPAFAEFCEKVVQTLKVRLSPGIDELELVEVLRSLNDTNNNKLPPATLFAEAFRPQS